MSGLSILKCWLTAIMSDHHAQFSRIIQCRECNSFVVDQIMSECSWIGDQFGVLPRIYCILAGIKSWDDHRLCCHNKDCNKKLDDIKFFRTATVGFNKFCSRKCACSDTSVIQLRISNQIKNNGGKYFSEKTMKHRRQAFIDHYGVDNNMKSEAGKAELRNAIQKKYGKGVTNVFQVQSIKDKSNKTKLDMHGDENYNNSSQISKSLKSKGENFYKDRLVRTKKTNIERYGEEHPMKSKKISEAAVHKSTQTMLSKYGVKSFAQTEQYNKKSRETSMKHFGTAHPMQNPTVRSKQQKSMRNYEVDSIVFDSSWELAFYLYHKSLGHDVVYNQNLAISYTCNGQQHSYIPDFIVDGDLYEIKGDHFFNENGDLICPYKKGISDEQYEKLNQIARAKQQCMRENNVIVVRQKDMEPILQEIEHKFGKDWTNVFKKKSNKPDENRSK